MLIGDAIDKALDDLAFEFELMTGPEYVEGVT
jgi:hypothetical protein